MVEDVWNDGKLQAVSRHRGLFDRPDVARTSVSVLHQIPAGRKSGVNTETDSFVMLIAKCLNYFYDKLMPHLTRLYMVIYFMQWMSFLGTQILQGFD